MELIVAVDANGGIGKNGSMLYALKEDLRRFRRITMGKTLVMGRSTFFSLPGRKPLPGRVNCVLSRSADILRTQYPAGTDGPFFYPDVDAFLQAHGDDAVMVIGGGDVYRQLLPLCTKAYVTIVHAQAAADTFFTLDANWKCISSEPFCDEGYTVDFCIFTRT